MPRPITFTLDLEDHRPDESAPVRFPGVCRAVLQWLDQRNIIGTFFVVGEVAESHPDLVREVAAAGHEIALHAWRHVPMGDLDPAIARAETTRGKALLEQLTQRECVGFRAPTYSLEPASAWLPDVLADLGFAYSSSVLAARNPLHGWPGAPAEPFRWPGGLVEFPVPVIGGGLVTLPYLGGTYLRLLPSGFVRAARAFGRGKTGRAPWLYIHAYDLDTDENYWRVPDAGALSPLLWVGRRGLWSKLDRLVAAGTGPPLRERLAEADGGVFAAVTHG